MGVLNVTPDSFSDGGRYLDPERAIARGFEMVAEGADVVDVGGESSRPGAQPVSASEELRRVLPVISALSGRVRVSVDTQKREVAEAAVDAGATIVNDITASLWSVAAEAGAGLVVMHMQGTPGTMQHAPHYVAVVPEVHAFLVERAQRAAQEGVREIWIDPGIGFGKTLTHNLQLLRGLATLSAGAFPVLVGTSRKSFLGVLPAEDAAAPLPPEERFEGSLATATWAMLAGASMVRVHDVAATVQAATLVGETRLGMGPGPEGSSDVEGAAA
jgi:dihydropteroate synthase